MIPFEFDLCRTMTNTHNHPLETMVLIVDGKLGKRRARKEQSVLFDLFKASDKIESSHKSDIFASCVSNMFGVTI